MSALVDIVGEVLSKNEYCDYLNSLIPQKYNFDCTYAVETGELAGGTLLYAQEDGTILSTEVDCNGYERDTWYSRLEECEEYDERCFEDDAEPDYEWTPEEPEYDMSEPAMTFTFVDEWRPVDGLSLGTFINPKKQLIEIIRKQNPYRADMASRINYPGFLLMQPELEQLKKAGYLIADNVLQKGFSNQKEIDSLRSILNNGSNLKQIFRMDKNVYRLLKEETNCNMWLLYCFMYRTCKFTRENIAYCVSNKFSYDEICIILSILKYGISFVKVVHYIERVLGTTPAQYENRKICLQEFDDALKMAKELNIKYNFGRYNLKDQHDKFSVLIRERTQKNLQDGFRQHYENWTPFAKKNNIFFIRPIEDQEELNREAAEQNNCVASYAQDIADGDSAIFVMRRNEEPDKSYATIEINPETGVVEQALLGENKPIEDKEALDFLTKWEKFVTKKLEFKK